MDFRSVVFLDSNFKAEDLLEEVGFRVHGEALDGGVLEAGEADVESAGGAGDFDFRNPLGMRAFEGVGDAENGGEFAHADAVLDAQCGVGRVVEARSGMAVVAGNQSDDGDVEAVETEDFRVQDDVFRMLVVRTRTDISANLMENRRNLQQEEIVFSELMQILEVVYKMIAEFSDMLTVSGIRLITPGEDSRRTQHLGREGVGELT